MRIEPGQLLLHYRIVEKIGEGGMGVVWKAVDTKLDREVAIKALPEGLAAVPARLERFEREAKAIAALNHPNVVTIHSIEEAREGRFLVMELIDGQTLDTMIPPEGLPLPRVFEIAVPMAAALASAHEKGLVHRDLKPANVMITAGGQVKVLDFGLAKLALELGGAAVGEEAPTRTVLTGEGKIVGTAPYMSPEQLHGRQVDPRSDIFSLGVVMYEMASGKRPFQGVSGMDLASSILKDTPRPVTELRAELPRHLGRIIQQCLEKKPEHRFQTATDVRNQLATIERETTSLGAPATPRAPSPRRWIAAGIPALLLLGLGGYALWRVMTPASEPSVAAAQEAKSIVVLPFENLGSPDDEYFADGMTEEITSRLAGLEGLAVISRTTAMTYKASRPSLREIGEELGVDYVLEGTVRWQRAADGSSQVRVTPQLIRVPEDTHLWADRYDRELENIFEVQSDIAKKVSAALGLALLETDLATLEARPTESLEAYDFYLRGNDYHDRGRDVISNEEVRVAVRMYEKAVGLDPGFALAHARLAMARIYLFRGLGLTRGDPPVVEAKAALDRALELDPDLPEAHLALGIFHSRVDRDPRRALAEFRRVQESQPNNAEVYNQIGSVQEFLGDLEAARDNLAKAVELNPRLGRFACEAGGVELRRRDFGEAIRHHERAIMLTPDRSCPYFCMVNIYLGRDGTTEQARRVLEKLPPGLDLDGERPPLNYQWVLVDMIDGRLEQALRRLDSGPSRMYELWDHALYPKDLLAGQIHRLMGDEDRAVTRFRAARDLLEAEVRERPGDDRLHGALGIAYAGLGRAEEAVREGELALEMIGDNQRLVGARLRGLAQIHSLLGNRDEALALVERLLAVPSFYAGGFIAMDPALSDLHDDPRFQALLAEYLPEKSNPPRSG